MLCRIKRFFTHDDKYIRDNRWIFASMLVGALCSLLASFVLSNEAIELAKNPDAVLSCSINIVLNCAKVGAHPSAHIFGFPNSFLGLMSEPVVITVAIAGLVGVKFPRKFMFVAQVCYTAGLVFAYWLFSQSYFVIGALCPWCLLVTATTTFVWFAMTRYNIRENNLYLPQRVSLWARTVVSRDYDKVALFSIVMLLIIMILVKYGGALFG